MPRTTKKPLTREQVLAIKKNADALLAKMEREDRETFRKAALNIVSTKDIESNLSGMLKKTQEDHAAVAQALNGIREALSRKKDFSDQNIIKSLQAIEKRLAQIKAENPEKKEKLVDRTDEVIQAIKSTALDPQQIPFPRSISIDNFPPQKVPTPVTKVAIRGGGTDDEATVTVLDNATALEVAIVDSSGNQVTSFGGGTQYTDGQAAPTNATGPTLVFDDAGTWKTVGSADPLPVNATIDTTGLATSAKQDTGNTSLAAINAKLVSGTDIGDVTINNAAGASAVNIQDGGNTITVDGTVAVSGTVTVDGSGVTQPVSHAALTELAAAINASSQVDVNIAASGATVPVSNAGLTALNGAISGTEVQVDIVDALPAGTNNIGDVDIASIAAGDNNIGNVDIASIAAGDNNIGNVDIASALPAGTNAIGKLAANSGVDIGDVDVTSITGVTMSNAGMQITGDEAHDAADAGNPVKLGAKAESALSGITLVADGDRTDLYAGLDGVLITRPYCNLEDIVSGVAAITDGSSTSVIASAGAGVKNYITSVMIANTSASAVTVDLRDGAAGTVKATLPVPANTAGVVTNFPVPLAFSAATAVYADPSAAASTVTVTLIGFKSKV